MTRMSRPRTAIRCLEWKILIVNSHFKRVVGYARTSDYVAGGLVAAFAPAALLTLEKFAPSHVGRGGFAKAMRLAGFVGLAGGFLYGYQRSARTSTTNCDRINGDMDCANANDLQCDSTVLRRTLARLRWICAKWSTRSRPDNPCTARAN